MKERSKKILQLFVEKFNRLKSNTFIEYLDQIKIRFSDKGLEVIGPNQEQIDSFTHTFRFFIRDGDNISFHKIAENLLDDPDLSENWKMEFIKLRDKLNQYLNEKPMIRIFPEREPLPSIVQYFCKRDETRHYRNLLPDLFMNLHKSGVQCPAQPWA